ncbi:MAG TPA: prepilin-type N-terminal cleavage/methylation domain-containing protein [Burkholderiales bacterium]|nr:prepilin-type N-terminal cleavage/methylation domain-containing protein [Burkholderiales bacterium]
MIRSKGFSLVELAVALAIIALLIAGALIPLSTQMDVRNVADTRRSMESIREAIIGFAQANGRLPCPADGTVPAGGSDAAGRPAGAEQLTPVALPPPSTAACTNSFGVIPWTTLGVPETDGWGRRFSYWVSPIFADGLGTATYNNPLPSPSGQNPACPSPLIPTPTQSSFALCSMGNLTVNTRNESTHAATAMGSVLPAVIISHGKNGNGAYIPTGSILAAPTGADETANATHTSAASTFFSRIPTPAVPSCNDAAVGTFCEFDDIVVMITSNTLIARMVAAGKLP